MMKTLVVTALVVVFVSLAFAEEGEVSVDDQYLAHAFERRVKRCVQPPYRGPKVCGHWNAGKTACTISGDPHLVTWSGRRGEAMRKGWNWVARYWRTKNHWIQIQTYHLIMNKRKITRMSQAAFNLPNGQVVHWHDGKLKVACKRFSGRKRVAGATIVARRGKATISMPGLTISLAKSRLVVTSSRCAAKQSFGWCSAGYGRQNREINRITRSKSGVGYNPAAVAGRDLIWNKCSVKPKKIVGRGIVRCPAVPKEEKRKQIEYITKWKTIKKTKYVNVIHTKTYGCSPAKLKGIKKSCHAAFKKYDLTKCPPHGFVSDCLIDACQAATASAQKTVVRRAVRDFVFDHSRRGISCRKGKYTAYQLYTKAQKNGKKLKDSSKKASGAVKEIREKISKKMKVLRGIKLKNVKADNDIKRLEKELQGLQDKYDEKCKKKKKEEPKEEAKPTAYYKRSA